MSSRTEPLDILMYHSVSERGGPTATPEPVFRAQMEAIADSGVPVLSLDALSGGWPGRGVVLTFDDGFQDFADAAWPVIRDHGWTALVYLPTAFVGGVEGWAGIAKPPRPLMDWTTIERLSAEGVQFGGHTINHPDLIALEGAALEEELTTSKALIAERTGQDICHFAPPYGRATDATRSAIRRHYATSCGTRLARATPRDDVFDLPRLEVFYYQDASRLSALLAGRGDAYLFARRTLRAVKDRISNPWSRV